MARSFASAVLLLSAALLMQAGGGLTHSATSSEALWRAAAVMPGSAVPDAVLRLLRRPDHSHFAHHASEPAVAAAAVPVAGSSGRARDDSPYGYDYKATAAGSGAGVGDDDFGYEYKAPTTQERQVVAAAAGGNSAAADARDDDFGYEYKAPTTTQRHLATTAGAGGRNSAAVKVDDFGYEYATDIATDSDRSHRRPTPTPATAKTTAVFFREASVRVGERLALHFRAGAPSALGLLPRAAADAIPFSAAALPSVLPLLGVAPGSPAAAAMAQTLRTCELSPPAGADAEAIRFCATSLEAMAELAVAALGGTSGGGGVRAITSALPRAGLPPQEFTVRAVRRVAVVSGAGGGGDSFVACHDEPYPYTVYRCHGTGPARAYLVEMEGGGGHGDLAGGVVITVATVCHTDTSRWNPEHRSFRVLGTRPGGEPVCHLMPYGHIIWAKNVDPSSSSLA